MSKYEIYKPSGIDWIGEVPAHWNIKRLKEISNVETGNTPSMSNPDFYSEEGMPWIKPDNLNDFIELNDSSEKLSKKGIKEARVVRKGAVLVCCIGTVGKIGVAGCSLATNQQINSVEFLNTRVLDKYGMYLLFTSEAELIKQSNKVVVSILNKVKQSQIKYPVPPIDEQLAITNYLDDQTQKIDRLIANKKAQAEKLKELRQIEINNAVTKGLNPNAEMKDSGIEWLRKIPKHWEYKRLKDLANVVLGKMLQNDDSGSDELKPYLRSFNVQWEKVDLSDVKEMWLSEYEKTQYRLKENDIVVSEGGEVGRAAIWKNQIDECYIQNSVHKVSCGTKLNPNFLLYQFTLLGRAGVFDMIINKVSIGHLTREKLVTVKFLVPPIEEQIEIANHLQKRTTAIDQLIKNIEAQIEKLQELRKIKIYEAVTGKIKVNAYAETTA